ncbi:beta-lactamase [Nitritalea halalkaliphila LW7]|uniref:Beta-lactamase n=1 Tax=Nitritalea halalkaliphila LW7 TaxID=1189621 RepID=I5C9P4_9BACT|nr:serine hydrolase domain-containing protein [Nitritalea halalkaliphila]EIM78546.1 beta-lactamase [Nitritalea halalkaliphila LW7]
MRLFPSPLTCLLGIFLLMQQPLLAQDPFPTATLDSLFANLLEVEAFNGNVLLIEKGEIVYQRSFGWAEEPQRRPLTADTRFELASVSKQFTAMGIVLLQQQGKLDYTQAVADFLPELAFYEDVTLLQLIQHTSGIPDYIERLGESAPDVEFITNETLIQYFAEQQVPLDFPPGTDFAYSNTGYVLLASVIERVSGRSFGDFLEEELFKPLGMAQTTVYQRFYAPKEIPDMALGYGMDTDGEKVTTAELGKEFFTYFLDGIVGDGMVSSTVGDLYRWDRALREADFLTPANRELLYTAARTADGTRHPYGFGWFVEEDPTFGKIAFHAGGWAGFTTYLERHLDTDKTLILLSNNSLPSTTLPVRPMRRALYREPIEVERKIKPSQQELQAYVGVYGSENFPLAITVTAEAGTLFTQATGQSSIPMEAYEGHIFKFEPAGITLVFQPEAGQFMLYQGSVELLFEKITD